MVSPVAGLTDSNIDVVSPEAHQWAPVLPPALIAPKPNSFKISPVDITGSRLQIDYRGRLAAKTILESQIPYIVSAPQARDPPRRRGSRRSSPGWRTTASL